MTWLVVALICGTGQFYSRITISYFPSLLFRTWSHLFLRTSVIFQSSKIRIRPWWDFIFSFEFFDIATTCLGGSVFIASFLPRFRRYLPITRTICVCARPACRLSTLLRRNPNFGLPAPSDCVSSWNSLWEVETRKMVESDNSHVWAFSLIYILYVGVFNRMYLHV